MRIGVSGRVVEVGSQDGAHASDEADVVVFVAAQAHETRGKLGVAEVDLGRAAAADEAADHLPDSDELAPRHPVLVLAGEGAVDQRAPQPCAPQSLCSVAECACAFDQAGALGARNGAQAVADLADGPGVHGLGDVVQVVRAWVRSHEEERCADGGTVVVGEDVVAAFHGQ